MSAGHILRMSVVVTCCCVSMRGTRADETPTLEELQAIANQWKDSFVNLRIVYELRSLPPGDVSLTETEPPIDPQAVHQFNETEWIWSNRGLDFFRERSFYWSPGTDAIRSIEVFNGLKGFSFRAQYEKEPDSLEKFRQMEILTHGGTTKPTSSFARVPLKGLYRPPTAEWLPDELASGKLSIESMEDVLGHRCVELRYDTPETRTTRVWLDLRHNALPRRWRTETHSTGTVIDFVIDEVQQLPNGMWFPRLCRQQLRTNASIDNQLVVVTEAAVNIELDMSMFEPPKPEIGTAVYDGRTGRTYTHGKPSPQPGDLPVDGRPVDVSATNTASKNIWIGVLAAASLALLTIGLRFRK